MDPFLDPDLNILLLIKNQLYGLGSLFGETVNILVLRPPIIT